MSGKDTGLDQLRRRTLETLTRRQFLRRSGFGLGSLALGALSGETPLARDPLGPQAPHFIPRAKRIIYLHMAGAPSQLELFDYKPELHKLDGEDCPPSFLEGKRFAFIRGVPKMLGPQAEFDARGESGLFVSNRLPHFAQVVDDVTLLKAVYTDEFNHAPAQLLMHTGSPRLGRPSMGSWVTYGLGSENQDLPGFVVLVSGGKVPSAGKSVWGSGFLPTVYQGVQCRSEGDPVLFISNPEWMTRDLRRKTVDAISSINRRAYKEVGDPEIQTRIAQYELAFRMQIAVPEVMDISDEPESIHKLYGTEPGKTSFANNCLLGRRLLEKGVRFVQLFHWGWDSHGTGEEGSLHHGFLQRCAEVDRPMSALLIDLKQRGLLDDTIVVWGGEFGRTPMAENGGRKELPFKGRDHHREAFTMWVAGGGFKQGYSYGETDEFGYSGIRHRVHVHDLQATLLHQLGMDHKRLTYHYQGREFRLTDVHGEVVEKILA